MINSNILQQYIDDGATVIRSCVNDKWLDLLQEAYKRNLNYFLSARNDECHSNHRIWKIDYTFQDFCQNSLLPKIAAEFLNSEKINLFTDQMFVKAPDLDEWNRTQWHVDLTSWPIRGRKLLTFWIALDHVNVNNGALEFIRDSHHQVIQQDHKFIEANRNQYEILSWDLLPGDAYVFYGSVMHGANGNRSTDVRRGYAVRYTGDDIVYDTRSRTNSSLHSTVHKDGDPLDSEQYPVVWRAI